jgi:hypothetical protein
MPAIWFGTVVRWTVVEKQEEDKKNADVADKVVSVLRRRGTHKPIKHLETKSINVYVSDDNITSEEVKVKIVAKYIGNNHGLWNDYAKGLLQVVDIEKTIVTPPRIPWDDQ